MTAKELAEKLNGVEYDNEVSRELAEQARSANLVIVYGASDDLMEFDGAIHDEVGCYEGGEAFITNKGLLENKCEDDDCPYFELEKKSAKKIEALWCVTNEYAWTYKSDIPHEEFDILEEGEKYSKGIVFSLNDV